MPWNPWTDYLLSELDEDHERGGTEMRELVTLGAFTFAIDVSPRAAAESVGEYVKDAMDAGESLTAIKDAARVAARYAAIVRRHAGIGPECATKL